jgi:glycosyltransferase involved in cell wall biosynthesis
MDTALLLLALITCITLIVTMIEFHIGFKTILNLSKQTVLDDNKLPFISIIFSALNEERDIENALKTMLALDYPAFEIIAINDRSSDRTPIILDAYQTVYSDRLRVIHITELPKGWLGKNHALHIGAKHAKGDWLLFTDADVIMKTGLLRKAISYATETKTDHLTIFEHHLRHPFWLKVFYLAHYLTYSLVVKPWRIRYTWSKRSLGHGSFNLVSKKSYLACGGHQAIAMECLDDLKFGQLLKQHGFHQDTVDGRDFIEREWYKTLAEMIYGLKKNSFAFYEYRLLPTLRDIVFAFIFYLWPVIAMFTCTGPIQWLNILNVALTLYMSVYIAKQYRLESKFAIFYPISILLLLYTILNSVVSIYANKGVVWRGTHYSLDQLRNKSDR